MKVEFKSSFLRDLKALRDKTLLARIQDIIEQLERDESPTKINNLKKLQGKGDYYRIRIGEFRLGLIIKDDTIIFVRCLNRRDVYKYFP